MERSKRCTRCKEEKQVNHFTKRERNKDGLDSWCKQCYSEVNRAYYRNPLVSKRIKDNTKRYRRLHPKKKAVWNTTWKKKYPEKYKAHCLVKNALYKGDLVKPDRCECCDKKRKVEAHHDCYTKPLDVVWLCKECHTTVHRDFDGNYVLALESLFVRPVY